MNKNQSNNTDKEQGKAMTYEDMAKRIIEHANERKQGILGGKVYTADELNFISDGYLPSQLELVQIAATLKQSEDFNSFNPSKAISCALDLWKTAHEKLVDEHYRRRKKHSGIKRVMELDQKYLHGHVKIGSHYFPPLDDEVFLSGKTIPLNEHLKFVTGLSRKEDQMLWFRSFLTATYRLRLYQSSNPDPPYEDHPKLGRHRPVRFGGYRWPAPEDFPINEDDRTIQEAIARLRKEGVPSKFGRDSWLFSISPASSRLVMAIEYREWRLTMKTPTKRAPKIYCLRDCSKKGLEWFEKPND